MIVEIVGEFLWEHFCYTVELFGCFYEYTNKKEARNNLELFS